MSKSLAVNPLRGLHVEDLWDLASERIVRRGLSYCSAGRVTDLAQGPNRVEGLVRGTGPEPYVVTVEHDGDELLPSCTCPFDWEPFCKHSIALLATALDAGEDASDAHARTLHEEREVRRKRALREGFRVRCLEGDGIFGTHEVESPSGRTYRVQIRSLSERINLCTCPDHATSMLGTCKHIEAVLAARRKSAPRKFKKLASSPPPVGMILVEQGETPRIRLVMPGKPTRRLEEIAGEYFDDQGYFAGDPARDFDRMLDEVRRVRKLVVFDDAFEHAHRAAFERRADERRRHIEREVLASGPAVPGIRARLYPYQLQGAAFLASRGRALLGDEMGLGKTVQAIAAARILHDRGDIHRALVVCPASLKHQWKSEIARFASIDAEVVQGGPPARLASYRKRAPFTIVNYEVVMRDGKGLGELAPDLLILDEAQRIKNWRTKTAEAIKSIDTPFAFVLTGTPLQNRLDDLYSIMQVVDRRILGPLWSFNESFVMRQPGRSRIQGYRNMMELRRRLAPAVLRREKSQVNLQLPERVDSRLAVELTDLQRDYMMDALQKVAMLVARAQKRPLTPQEEKKLFMNMQNARMACNAAGLVDKETRGSPKLDELEPLLEELCVQSDRKVVIFSEWEKYCRLVAQRAEGLGIGYERLHGGVPSQKRGALIERFRDDPECRLFISTDAGGTGLNLQFASTLINMELPWNPAVLEQRIGRVHRHGQRESVHVIMLVSEPSLESAIEKVLETKRDVFDAALSPGSRVDDVDAPASCLHLMRGALFELDSEQEGEEPVLLDSPPAARPEPPAGEAGEPPDPLRELVDVLGPRVQRALTLASGRVLAQVDRVDETAREAAQRSGLTVADASTMQTLEALGPDSPFAQATVVMDRPAGGDPAGQVRSEAFAVARRKLQAARSLATAGLSAEAIGQAHACMNAALRAMAAEEETASTHPARLLYEVLVPRGLLTLEQAALVSRAEGLASAYGDSTTPVPSDLLESVLSDATGLVERMGTGAPPPRTTGRSDTR